MRISRDAVGVNQVPALRISHTALGDNLAITNVPGPHGTALNVLDRFRYRFYLLFDLIQTSLLLNIQQGHFGDQLCL